MKFTQLAAFASIFAAAYAQSISIAEPTNGMSVPANTKLLVRVEQPVSL